METNIISIDNTQIRRIGTREEVFKGLAVRTAGGLKKNDIIIKQFGTKVLYISKRLSDKMRENFQHSNYFRKRARKTLMTTNNNIPQIQQDILNKQVSANTIKAQHNKTLKFKINNNTVKNVYYKELLGHNLQKLKEELKKEELQEDLGIHSIIKNNEFKIEDIPEIILDDLE